LTTYYEILGIAKEAKQAEIKSAFKRLALKHHPDKNPNNPQSEEAFKKINEAYQTLSDGNKRWAYNQKLYAQQAQYRTQPTETPRQTPNQTPNSPHFSTQANAKSFNKYSGAASNTSAGDYSNQGKYYEEAIPRKKERASDSYILALTLFVIIATGALLFGFMMNKIAAKDHYTTAISLYETEDYPKALIQLNMAIEFQEDYTEAYILRGDINLKLERYSRALPDFNKAIKLSKTPDNELINKRNICRTKIKDIAF